ncbi:MAG: sialate O-acetylesterase [Bacteroidota bacterium]
MKKTTAFVLAAALAFLHVGCTTDAEPEGTTYKLYYLGGQSNMDGYGFSTELPEPAANPSQETMIFVGQVALDNDTRGGVGVWQPLQPGFGTGYQTDGVTSTLSDRFGPELLFGQVMAQHVGDAHVAVVKYALGGSGLAEGVGFGNWDPDFSEGAGINQYDHALKTLRNALAHSDIDGDGIADRLIPSGIVWMQGEADALHSQAVADDYRANLERLMGLLRAALRVDDLPLVIGRITDSGMAEDGSMMDFIETVQDAQREVVAGDRCAEYVTATEDLGYLEDGWHYDSDGFIRLGTAFAEAMIELEQRCGHTE